MADIRKIFLQDPENSPCDSEQMLRETLVLKITSWLQSGRFSSVVIRELYGMISEMGYLPTKTSGVHLPQNLASIHCLRMSDFPVNSRRGFILECLRYVSITEQSAPDIVGAQGWSTIKEAISTVCSDVIDDDGFGDITFDGPDPFADEPELLVAVRPGKIDPWVTATILQGFKVLFSGRFFDICEMDRMKEALDEIRETLKIENVESEETKIVYAGLRALHVVYYDKMNLAVIRELKEKMVAYLAIDQPFFTAVFGNEAWHEFDALNYDQYINRAERGDDPPPSSLAERKPFLTRLYQKALGFPT